MKKTYSALNSKQFYIPYVPYGQYVFYTLLYCTFRPWINKIIKYVAIFRRGYEHNTYNNCTYGRGCLSQNVWFYTNRPSFFSNINEFIPDATNYFSEIYIYLVSTSIRLTTTWSGNPTPIIDYRGGVFPSVVEVTRKSTKLKPMYRNLLSVCYILYKN